MAFMFRTAAILLASTLLWSQVLSASALTEEEKLRAAISDPKVTSFELKSDIKLTKDLPALALISGKVRAFKLFSTAGYAISGVKKYRGFWTPDTFGFSFPAASLTIDNVKLTNFRVKYSRATSNIFGSLGFNGGAIGVEYTSVTLVNTVIQNCAASGTGGAIYMYDGTLTVRKSTLSGNIAAIGGAFDIGTQGKALTIEDSTFSGNKANGITPFGGAVNIQLFAVIKISRTTFKGNSAGSGGAVRAVFNDNEQPSTPILFDSATFDSNTATDAEGGGAVEVNGVKEIQFLKPVFKTNVAPATGAKNIFVITPPGFKTTIRVNPAPTTITDIKGNNPNNFAIAR